MITRWVELRMTNATADRLVAEDLAETFSERFIRGEKYTDIRFGPFDLRKEKDLNEMNDLLDFMRAPWVLLARVTTKPY